MGVTGLWALLEPVGRRISIESLAQKRLAVGEGRVHLGGGAAAQCVRDPRNKVAAQGLPPAVGLVDDSAALRERRSQTFAGVQEHYYAHPPRIERGWREHLIGIDGRVYLDMVNNVAVLGHGHPGLADAVARPPPCPTRWTPSSW